MVPVIYHGGGGGVAPWPAAAAAPYVPSASVLGRSIWINASDMQPNLDTNQDNPPIVEHFNSAVGGSPAAWFGRVMTFPRAQFGGAWAQGSFYLPANLDITAGTLPFRVVWWGGIGSAGNLNWHIHLTVENPGVVILGGGPGTQVNQIGVLNQCMYTPVANVPPTRGGAQPLVPDRMYHFNLYRGDNDAQIVRAVVFGLIINYQVVP